MHFVAKKSTYPLVSSRVPCWLLTGLAVLFVARGFGAEQAEESLRLVLSWGHQAPQTQDFFLRLTGKELRITDLQLERTEAGDRLQETVARTRAGAGDSDGLSCTLKFVPRVVQPITNVQQIWQYLLKQGDAGAAQRLQADPAMRPDPRQLTLQWDEPGTRGFSLSVDQLLRQRTFWLPEFDLYLSAGEPVVSYEAHQRVLASQQGQRVLDRVARSPEATYAEYAALWEDMGHPSYRNPHSVPPGHTVGLTWDSALYKFGVDRWGEVRNDYGKADVFHFRVAWPGRDDSWRSQRLSDGLPIITTIFEHEGLRYEVEQFAYPLLGPPRVRQGDIAMVLLQKIVVQELEGRARSSSLELHLTRDPSGAPGLRQEGETWVLGTETATWLTVRGADSQFRLQAPNEKEQIVQVQWELPARGRRELIINLPSPVVAGEGKAALLGLQYNSSRAATVQYWSELLERGAFFHVPDEAVNTLFRANLWHALRLPRRHGGDGPDVKIDLPYSNFAYDQQGTPWPVNQSVYVDYMLFDLRGYHEIAAEELAAMYKNNQEPNGHVGGIANWGVYTPSMLYSVAQHYLLSGNRASFESLLPQTLRALDWCLAEIRRTSDPRNPAPGLMLAPLNDLTHDARSWAFNQAYFVAGFDMLGRALAAVDHPRAEECRTAAVTLRQAIEREFGRASVRSPAVQLADATWTVYVPTDAQASGRMFQVWYPTDVDVGPLHLPRLKALDARGPLVSALLNDHEDNLLLKQWGTINEPVYNMQGTVYLLRDEPKAAIRTFYSTLACAFSHSVFEPVEHRWAWGQYFGPPSTDGAWFELYRNMLLHEQDDSSLLLGQAVPRAWLESGQRIEVSRAPTYFGPVSFTMEGAGDEMIATVDLPERRPPSLLLVRLRDPKERPMRSVSVNGAQWTDFDAGKEWVRIPNPAPERYTIVTRY